MHLRRNSLFLNIPVRDLRVNLLHLVIVGDHELERLRDRRHGGGGGADQRGQ